MQIEKSSTKINTNYIKVPVLGLLLGVCLLFHALQVNNLVIGACVLDKLDAQFTLQQARVLRLWPSQALNG